MSLSKLPPHRYRVFEVKYTTLLLGLAIMASITAADAKVDRACLRGEIGKMFNAADTKRICDPKNYVGPNQLGWNCEAETGKLYKVKGQGARHKRDAICE
jgi:hypothetical protein